MKRETLGIALLTFGTLAAGCSNSSELIEGDDLLVLSGVTLIDGTGAPPRENTVIVVHGDRIFRVGEVGDFQYPDDATVVDLTGRWLLPGFMDLHAHITDAEPQEEVLATLLQFGITTFRSPGARAPPLGTALRDRIAIGEILGPRMFTAGRLMDLPGGSPAAVKVATTEEVRAEVRRQAEAGVDFVKLYAQLGPEMIRAGIEEAHAAGVGTIGHLGKTGWADASVLGIDAVMHSGTGAPTWELVPPEERARFLDFHAPLQRPEFDPTLFGAWREAVDLDGPEMAALVAALAEHRVEVNPTLIMMEVMYWGDDPELLEAIEPQYAPASLATTWRAAPHPYSVAWPEESLADAKKTFPLNLEIVRRLHQGGVLLTAGTDFGNPWITPGVSLHREMWLLHEAGIPVLEVLTIATRNGAEALGILDEVGTIEMGKRADLVILSADPLDDIRNTRAIEAVYLGGERIAVRPHEREEEAGED